MSNYSEEITIKYEDQEFEVDLDDLQVNYLVEAFGLAFTPLVLHSLDPRTGKKKIIPIKNKSKFEPGHTYYITDRARNASPRMSETSDGRANMPPPLGPSTSTPIQVGAQPWKWEPLSDVVQNSVILCRAAYASSDLECDRLLSDNLDSHNFQVVSQSHHGGSRFVIGQESGANRIYIAFRGTNAPDDWRDNIQAYQVEAVKARKQLQGKVHSGFLKRAMDFPIEKILNDEELHSKNIVFCGHSLGGAVATLVSVLAMMELERRRNAEDFNQRWIKCITFGAPLVGDSLFRQFCDVNSISRHMYHFVNEEDPVPRILSYSQLLSAMSSQLENDIRALVSAFPNREGTHFYESKRRSWIDQKDRYTDMLGKITPILEPVLEFTSYALPKYAGAIFLAKGFSKVIQDVVLSTQNGNSKDAKIYANLGNYMFLSPDNSSNLSSEFQEEEKIDKLMELSLKHYMSQSIQSIPVNHAVHSYESVVGQWTNLRGTFPVMDTHSIVIHGQIISEVIPRKLELVDMYTPLITAAELVRVSSHNQDYLRLRITGFHLFEFVLDECNFNFGYPFASNPEKAITKKVSQGDNVETLIFQEEYKEPPFISDHGTLLTLVTKFGTSKYLLRKDKIRNIVIPTINELLSHHDSLSVLVKRAIQRGMAIAQLRRSHGPGKSAWKAMNESIIQEVMKLSSLTLEKAYVDQLLHIFEDTNMHVQFILSHEDEFQRVQTICDKIQEFLRKPLKIRAEKSVIAKIGIGVATLLGGAVLAYAAGPGMVVIGVAEAMSMPAAGLAGAMGTLGTGFVTNMLFTSSMVDENYEQVLSWVTMELYKRLQKAVESTKELELDNLLQQVTDLREDGSLFSMEKALLLVYNPEIGTENFSGCDLENCIKESKMDVIKRIECIRAIHNIRTLMAKQCYIGIVGIQDSGKTTLINSIWGVGGRTGQFLHTDVPSIYEVHKKVLVVDFPGTTSLDYHAKTFSICGAMNNLIIVVVPYTGDMSEIIAREISRVFEVMAGSESSRVILCINKAGYELPRALQEEMGQHPDPMKALKQRFAVKLNDFYESKGSNFSISEESILFTDWKVGDDPEMRALGIVGVEGIKAEINKYLKDQSVFDDKDENTDLQTCLSKDNLATMQ